MTSRSLAVALALVAVSACSEKKGGVLIVSVSSTTTLSASSVQLDVTAGGRMRTWTAELKAALPPAVDYAIQIPPDALGSVSVTATAGGQTAMGSTTVAAGQTATMSLVFGQVAMGDGGADLVGATVDMIGQSADGGTDMVGQAGDMVGATGDMVGQAGDMVGATGDMAGATGDMATSPSLSSNPPSLSFGDIATNATSAGVSVTITNNGTGSTGTLTVSSGNAVFAISADTCSTKVLAPTGTCSFTVTFGPTAQMAYNSSISVGGLSISAIGTGVAPGALQATPSSRTFSNFVLGTTLLKQSFSIKNTGGVNSGTISVGTPSGTNAAEFQVTSTATCGGANLTPNATCTIEVTYNPGARGSHVASLDVTAATAGKVTISLSGNALDPARISLTAQTTADFGTVTIGSPKALKFVVANLGDVDMPAAPTIDFSVATTVLSVTNNNCSAALKAKGAGAGQENCTFDVVYAPMASGSLTSGIAVRATVTGVLDSPASVALTGQGQTAANLGVLPSMWNFNQQLLNTDSASKEFTITNSGQQPSGAITLALAGNQPGDFKIVTSASMDCAGVSLGFNQSCKATVVFRPTATGYRSATLSASGATAGSTPPVLQEGTGYTCTDNDGDGAVVESHAFDCGPVLKGDCNDSDPNNWSKCTTCKDTDGDGFFAGCDRYFNKMPDCDDTKQDVSHMPEIIGNGIDEDCDGQDLTVGDQQGVFVAPAGGPMGGNDANPGTKLLPVATLNKAASLAAAQGKRAVFMLFIGYPADLPTLANRSITFYGGFDYGFSTRGVTNGFITASGGNGITTSDAQGVPAAGFAARTIVGLDQVTITGADTPIYASRARVVGRSIATTASTANFTVGVYVDDRSDFTCVGCDLRGGSGNNSSGVSVDGRAVLDNCMVRGTGGATTQSGYARGIIAGGGANIKVLNFSDITGGKASTVRAIELVTSASGLQLTVDGSTLHGGESTGECDGLYAGTMDANVLISRSKVEGCTSSATAMSYAINYSANSGALRISSSGLYGSQGLWTYGLNLGGAMSVDLWNNIVDMGAGTNGAYGLFLLNNGGLTRIMNNYFVVNGSNTAMSAGNNGGKVIDMWTNLFSVGHSCVFDDGSGCKSAPPNSCAGSFNQRCLSASNNQINSCTFSGLSLSGAAGPCDGSSSFQGTDPTAFYSTPPADLTHDFNNTSRPKGQGWDIGPTER